MPPMKLGHKIFAANLVVTFLLFFLIMVCLRLYTGRQIRSFINSQEIRGLEIMAGELAGAFQAGQGWDGFETSPDKLAGLTRRVFKTLPPFHMLPPKKVPPLPADAPFRPPDPARFDPVGRIALYSPDKILLAGPVPAPDTRIFRPITIGNQVVGWLGLAPIRRIHHPLDATGLRQKLNAVYLAGFLIFLITGLASFFLSRFLLKPVKRLTAATRALAGLDFRTRIPVTSRDELGLLAQDFNAMSDTIQAYEATQKQWVLDISHELRTPLSILKGEAEAMLDGVRPADRTGIRSLYTEIRTLESLVRDLHFLSQEDARSLEMRQEPTYPTSILREVLSRFEKRLSNAGIRVENRLTQERYRIRGDAARLGRMFSNLLENSLRYTEKPGTLTLDQEIDGALLKIRIEDSGPGVPEETVDRLFDRLYRGDRARARYREGDNRGTGLGLSICKTIVRAHRGEIRAANIPGRGLGIFICLPLEEGP